MVGSSSNRGRPTHSLLLFTITITFIYPLLPPSRRHRKSENDPEHQDYSCYPFDQIGIYGRNLLKHQKEE